MRALATFNTRRTDCHARATPHPDRRAVDEPDPECDHRHRAMRRCLVRQGRWASARGKREAAKGASNVVGTTVLTGVRTRDGRWTGTLFIPDDDIHVAAQLQLAGNGSQAHRLRFRRAVLPLTDVDPHRRAVAPRRLAERIHPTQAEGAIFAANRG